MCRDAQSHDLQWCNQSTILVQTATEHQHQMVPCIYLYSKDSVNLLKETLIWGSNDDVLSIIYLLAIIGQSYLENVWKVGFQLHMNTLID